MLYSLVKHILFQLDPELAHTYVLTILKYLPSLCFKTSSQPTRKIMGLNFPNPIGLAAGLDKSGQYIDALAKLGFGFIEIGTVTPLPQPGNPKPRLFRLPKSQALINRMGFNNPGVDALVRNVQQRQFRGILGINIGKGRETVLNKAAEDYVYCLERVYPHASYITINISSPNTPDLRQLQQKDYLVDLLQIVRNSQLRFADRYARYVPLVIKISPDEADESLKTIADIIYKQKIDGIIATNTTCARNGVDNEKYAQETGGLSGRPLQTRSTECLKILQDVVGSEVTLIGVGGIDSETAAQQKMAAGARLLQVYTGLIYQGPGLISKLVRQVK